MSVSKLWQRWAANPRAEWSVYWWALFEALFWFIFPDFYLMLLAAAVPRKTFRYVSFATCGMVTGGVIGFFLSFFQPHLLMQFLTHIPLVQDSMVTLVQRWYVQEGTWALWHQLPSLIPYKVFVLASGNYSLNFPLFILLSIFVRFPRFYLTSALAALIGGEINQRWPRLIWSVYLGLTSFNFWLLYLNHVRYAH